MPNTGRPTELIRAHFPGFSIFLIFFLVFSGCSIWDSATSYFNTYYNAQRQYHEAEDDIWNQPELKQTGRNLLQPINTLPQTKVKFTAVIEKCSKLLQYHPESSLVDDALLMIAKSYYYENEFQQAERKFKELLDMYPNSSLVLETRLMRAFTYYKMENKDSAAAEAAAVKEAAKKDGDDAIAASAALILGQVSMEKRDYRAARDQFQFIAEQGVLPEQRTSALLNIALMDSADGDYASAEKDFRRSEAGSNNYVGEYTGKIGAIRMVTKLGRYDAALAELADLRANVKYREYFGIIDYEIARVYEEKGDIPSALARYKYVDTLYARTETAANAAYQLGRLYETRVFMLDSARSAYNRGSSHAPLALITPQLSRRADYLTKYFRFRSEIARYDSVRTSILNFRDSTYVVHDSTRGDSVVHLPPPGKGQLDTVEIRLAKSMGELATLFYTGLKETDSARVWYQRILKEFPDGPVTPRALFTLAQIYIQDSTSTPGLSDSLNREVVRRFPDSEFAAESSRQLGLPPIRKQRDEAGQVYAQGEELLLKEDYPAAIQSFRVVLERFPRSASAAGAQYAIGWIYENKMPQLDSALANYQSLVSRFPASRYVASVRPKLAEVEMMKKIESQKSVKDTAASPKPKIQQDELAPVRKNPIGTELPRKRETPDEEPALPPKPLPGANEQRPKN